MLKKDYLYSNLFVYHFLPFHSNARGDAKCLDNWLCQGIICASESPCTLQTVIKQIMSGEICLYTNYWKLHFQRCFPVLHIDEALQTIWNHKWFTSFDLGQGYLQLAMDETDINMIAFRVRSSGLYKFTHMPFGLMNTGCRFCRLMEQCQGDKQFLTLLIYLDDICIFTQI